MGAVASVAYGAKRRVKAYLLRPFKRRGYLLTAAEHRALHPTYHDKVASGKYTKDAVSRMKLKHRDVFVSMRQGLHSASQLNLSTLEG